MDYIIDFFESTDFAMYYKKPEKIIIYNLNQNNESLEVSINYPIEIIDFPWSEYPVQDIHTFSWKTIIWFKHLAEFDGIFWFDASVAPNSNNFKNLALLTKEKIDAKSCGFFYGETTFHTNGAATCARMTDYLPLKYRHQNLWYGHNIIEDKQEFLEQHEPLFYPPIFPNGEIYNPRNRETFRKHFLDKKTNQLSMEQAGTMVLLNSKSECFEKIFLPAYLCSNLLDCIAPIGSTIDCVFFTKERNVKDWTIEDTVCRAHS